MPKIQTTESIDASPERVWAVLTDLDYYPEWNPFIVEGSGEIREGGKLNLKMRLPNGRAMNIKPKVREADPGRELRWFGRLLIPRLFDGEHWFRLEPEGSGTRLEQGEEFSGLLPRFMSKTLRQTELAFRELNEALKDRAETV